MNEFILMWLLSSLINFSSLAEFLVFVSTFVLILPVVGITCKDDPEVDGCRSLWKACKIPYLILYTLLWFMVIFIPSKDDLFFILGGGAALYVASDEEVQQLPGNLAKAANDWLENYYTTEEQPQ